MNKPSKLPTPVPMTRHHQRRRQAALERLEARIARQKEPPTTAQLLELATLRWRLHLA